MTVSTNFQLSPRMAGEEALLAAVIARAVKDVLREGAGDEEAADAMAYFAGRDGVYREHLEYLGLPSRSRPTVFDQLLQERQRESN